MSWTRPLRNEVESQLIFFGEEKSNRSDAEDLQGAPPARASTLWLVDSFLRLLKLYKGSQMLSVILKGFLMRQLSTTFKAILGLSVILQGFPLRYPISTKIFFSVGSSNTTF